MAIPEQYGAKDILSNVRLAHNTPGTWGRFGKYGGQIHDSSRFWLAYTHTTTFPAAGDAETLHVFFG